MTHDSKSRQPMDADERLAARERANAKARETLAEERYERGDETDRPRQARMQAQQQNRQPQLKETFMVAGQPLDQSLVRFDLASKSREQGSWPKNLADAS